MVSPTVSAYAALQQQRKLERGLRQWKRREAVAITPEAEQKAKGKVKEWRTALKTHVESTNEAYRKKYGKDPFGNDRQLTYRQSWREADKVTTQAEKDAAAIERTGVRNARILETKRIQADILTNSKYNKNYLKVKIQQQEQHISGTKAFIREQSKGSIKSYFEGYTTSDIQDVVNKKAGKGYSAVMTPGSKYPSEYVKMSEAVGKTWDDKQGKYIDTDVFKIRYSSKGVHAFPVSPKKGKTK